MAISIQIIFWDVIKDCAKLAVYTLLRVTVKVVAG